MLSRNYSTRDFFFKENGKSKKSKCSFSTVSTCNTMNVNQSFELDSCSKGKGNFDDNDLDNSMNNLFSSMDYDMETQSEIQKINNYHSKKRQQFINNYRQKKETTMKDLCCSMDVNYQDYLDFKNPFSFLFKTNKIEDPKKMKKMEELKKIEDKYNAQYLTILNEIENKRINAVNNYKEQRDIQNIIDSLA